MTGSDRAGRVSDIPSNSGDLMVNLESDGVCSGGRQVPGVRMPSWSSFDPEADRKLVRGLNEGDRDALAMLYDTYGERLYDYSMSLAQESKAAADLVHDSFIDAYRSAPRRRD